MNNKLLLSTLLVKFMQVHENKEMKISIKILFVLVQKKE